MKTKQKNQKPRMRNQQPRNRSQKKEREINNHRQRNITRRSPSLKRTTIHQMRTKLRSKLIVTQKILLTPTLMFQKVIMVMTKNLILKHIRGGEINKEKNHLQAMEQKRMRMTTNTEKKKEMMNLDMPC